MVIDEPELAFHADRASDRHVHPLLGLATYGPYSRSTLAAVADPIRLAVISPIKLVGAVDR